MVVGDFEPDYFSKWVPTVYKKIVCYCNLSTSMSEIVQGFKWVWKVNVSNGYLLSLPATFISPSYKYLWIPFEEGDWKSFYIEVYSSIQKLYNQAPHILSIA